MSSATMSTRPDPDALLAQLRGDDAARARGRLRIYFGASAGVGKTFAMLTAGRRLAADGRDVVVGIVETHGRAETEALLRGDANGPSMDVLPRARRSHESAAVDEFDLDAVLARKPQLVLVDELAHSNAPGSRHPKRWQDVDELLSAGIDVFTTLNVQHLESLNDVVGGITGIRVHETVPDTFFDRADEVVLVDVTAEELLTRLESGKVYLPEQAQRAARNFFRKGNLIALREIALRRTADRVEGDVQAYRDDRAIERVWATDAALLCCIGPDLGAERVVRAAARLAVQLDVTWQAVYVETPRLQRRSSAQRERILRVVALAQQLGASVAVLSGSDVADALAGYARQHNIGRMVLGRTSARSGLARWAFVASMTERIALAAPETDLVVVGGDADARDHAPAASTPDAQLARPAKAKQRRIGYAVATIGVAIVTAVAMPLAGWLHATNIAMIDLLVVTMIAMRFGRRPAVLASLLAVGSFDFFFVPPRYSFAVADAQYAVTLVTMLTIAIVVGTLAANLRYQARVAAHREERSRALYEIARDLSKALQVDDVIAHVRTAVGALLRADVHVLLPEASARPVGRFLAIDRALKGAADFEPAIAQWSYEHGHPAGAGTDTLPGSPWLFLPLTTPIGARGVLAVRPSQRRLLLIPEQRQLLETLAALVATAIERVHYADVAQKAMVGIESERLRNSLLSAISHDLRTPIAAIGSITETLALALDDDGRPHDRDLVDALRAEVARMSALVENLLDMARIESGDVKLKRHWHAIEETIGTALAALRRELRGHRVVTNVPAHLPLVEYDAVLIERVVHNLVANAAKYSPAGSAVSIEAWSGPDALHVAVEDDGPGLPATFDSDAKIAQLFEKFTRGVEESSTPGVGLGLAICRAIVEAHGGTIAIEPARTLVPVPPARGFRVVVTLPRREAPAVDETVDVESPALADA